MSKYANCKQHEECRHVKGDGGMLEIIKCPWCGYSVSTSNPGNWCASCYTIFRIDNGRVHFGKRFQKTVSQALAIAMSKAGGFKMGTPITHKDDKKE